MGNPHLTVAGEATEVLRTTRDRWFSWPWRPWVKTWMYVPRLPDPHFYEFEDPYNGKIWVAHPETIRVLQTMLEKADARR